MSKLLTIDEMLDCARALLSDDEAAQWVNTMETGATMLALRLAEVTGASLYAPATEGDGGIMASFRTGENGEQPEIIGSADKDGDWD